MVYGRHGVMKNHMGTVGSSVLSLKKICTQSCSQGLSPVIGKDFGIFYINDLVKLIMAVALINRERGLYRRILFPSFLSLFVSKQQPT